MTRPSVHRAHWQRAAFLRAGHSADRRPDHQPRDISRRVDAEVAHLRGAERSGAEIDQARCRRGRRWSSRRPSEARIESRRTAPAPAPSISTASASSGGSDHVVLQQLAREHHTVAHANPSPSRPVPRPHPVARSSWLPAKCCSSLGQAHAAVAAATLPRRVVVAPKCDRRRGRHLGRGETGRPSMAAWLHRSEAGSDHDIAHSWTPWRQQVVNRRPQCMREFCTSVLQQQAWPSASGDPCRDLSDASAPHLWLRLTPLPA